MGSPRSSRLSLLPSLVDVLTLARSAAPIIFGKRAKLESALGHPPTAKPAVAQPWIENKAQSAGRFATIRPAINRHSRQQMARNFLSPVHRRASSNPADLPTARHG